MISGSFKKKPQKLPNGKTYIKFLNYLWQDENRNNNNNNIYVINFTKFI